MSRPLRIEFPGAVYHITSRGDRREQIFEDDADRRSFLEILDRALTRFEANCLAFCLMGNHYHLVLCTRQANLSRLMRHVNGVYTQAYNRRYTKVGHVLQGRFKAILVDRDACLVQLCRYVERNPVAAGLVVNAADWPWSSCRHHMALAEGPAWLDSQAVWQLLLGHSVEDAAARKHAGAVYAGLIAAPAPADFWTTQLRQQIYLGNDDFVRRMQANMPAPSVSVVEVPRLHRCTPCSGVSDRLRCAERRNEELRRAYREGNLTMTAIARELGLSVSTVSRLIARAETEAGGQVLPFASAKGKT